MQKTNMVLKSLTVIGWNEIVDQSQHFLQSHHNRKLYCAAILKWPSNEQKYIYKQKT